MQRYARLRAGFTTIERDARRRAARIRRLMSANPLGLRDDLVITRVEGFEGLIIAPCPHADARDGAFHHARRTRSAACVGARIWDLTI